ncbi:replication protein a 70 kda dna-binding [Plasmopara halstedii]|uniref:Replication protein A subunit n=1 Tax=Plasmopara halstedii TaxID=4781 RepID=A0A0N7L5B2_PLAHL|nr:replication protein a 70 kda dna-binding [Plasmopara halstedii]CEG40987.1 replication protein a 70 kda dna-binding [Plasmopara halstedii]|eukprot:XP_024577356.1 replication protein a 70 kda dna-binding [Plasmopara halstedii]
MVNLTPNAVSMLYHSQAPEGFEPWLQVIDIKKIKPASGAVGDRYRIMLSDGTSYISGMLATQLAPLMEKESLKSNFVLQLKDYLSNEVQGRRIIIVLKIGDIVPAFDCIGSPENIESSKGFCISTAPAIAAPPAASLGARPSVHAQTVMQSNRPPIVPSSYAPPAKSAQPVYNRGPVVRQDLNIRLSDIHSLNPYAGGRWTIKARVTTRAPVKTWTNTRGSGKLFSVDLLDAKGGEIRATFFNDGVDKFYEMLRPGCIFYFAGGKVKMANRRFSSMDNDYEVTFDQHSEISPAPEDGQISQMHYSFKKIADIESIPSDSSVDVVAVVRDVGPVTEITSKAGKQLFKRDISLVDDSNAEIKCTMWNERAQEDCSGWLNQVLAIKGCRVSEYNGRSIGTVTSSSFVVNPAIPEAGHLVTWFSNGGSGIQANDINGKQLGFGQKPDYITIKGTVNFIKHDIGVYYQACPKCQKKVVADVAQNYTCEKCQTSYPNCENRYILSVVMLDHTGSTFTTCFDDQGKVVMGGRTADEIGELRDTNMALYESVFKGVLFKQYVCRLRVKAENVQEELRVKASVVNIEPVNFAHEAKDLVQAIAQYN